MTKKLITYNEKENKKKGERLVGYLPEFPPADIEWPN